MRGMYKRLRRVLRHARRAHVQTRVEVDFGIDGEIRRQGHFNLALSPARYPIPAGYIACDEIRIAEPGRNVRNPPQKARLFRGPCFFRDTFPAFFGTMKNTFSGRGAIPHRR